MSPLGDEDREVTHCCHGAVAQSCRGNEGRDVGALQHPTLTPDPGAVCDKLLVGEGT